MSTKFEAIKGDHIPGGSIVLMRSDRGFHPEVCEAVLRRMPKDSILLCLRPGESVELLDEGAMRRFGWQRIPKLIVYPEHHQYPKRD